METEINNQKAAGNKIFLLLIIVFSAFIVYYSIMSIISPARKLVALKTELISKTVANTVIDERKFADSAFLSLLKMKAILQSGIALAETDSIYLILNLADSTANIAISGVTVHKAKIGRIYLSKILKEGDESIISEILSKPLTILNDISTIRKEPVMIKMAPKDTSEYEPDILPDTSLTEPVSYILELNHGIRVYVSQKEIEKSEARMDLLLFDMKDRYSNIKCSIKKVLSFKVPEYHPYIKITLPRSDAKIIYRAVPKNGQVGIFM